MRGVAVLLETIRVDVFRPEMRFGTAIRIGARTVGNDSWAVLIGDEWVKVESGVDPPYSLLLDEGAGDLLANKLGAYYTPAALAAAEAHRDDAIKVRDRLLDHVLEPKGSPA